MAADPHVAYRRLIAQVYEVAGLSRRSSDRDAAAEHTTTAQWHVLSVLSGGPATVPQVARRLGQARQSVQRVADELVAHGDVRPVPNPDHARSSRASASSAMVTASDTRAGATASSCRPS